MALSSHCCPELLNIPEEMGEGILRNKHIGPLAPACFAFGLIDRLLG